MAEIKHETFGSVGEPNTPKPIIAPIQKHIAPEKIDAFDFRSLVELGRVQDSIKIGNFTFEMATLDDVLQSRAYSILQNDPEKVTLRRIIIALALLTINGKEPEKIVKIEGTSEEKRLYLVGSLQGSVAEKLIDFYDKLLDRSQKEVTEDIVKN